MRLQESAEMYLETIHVLSQQKNIVRSIDVAEHMGYSKPSVSRAVGLLREGGYITVGEDGSLCLTESGEAVALKIFERHTVLTGMLVALGVDEKTASEDACKIEHVISDSTFDAIKKHIGK
ncbi:MAG: metal-dependent transcriptional regulator [Ruminococcaceae bacterium]|nr:metal-dependent transcriptional regulator [Oscillospiraceae bacterium]